GPATESGQITCQNRPDRSLVNNSRRERAVSPDNPRAARAREPDALTLDAAVKLAAVLVPHRERPKVGQQGHAASLPHGAAMAMPRIRYTRGRTSGARRFQPAGFC